MKGIYKIQNLVNGKVYIGQSLNVERRWRTERSFSGVNPHLKNSFKKYGMENFFFELIEETENLNEREIYWIDYYQSYDPKKGYNKTLGGREEVIYTEDARKRMSERNKGEGNPNFGNRWNEEQRAEASKRNTGKKYSAETKKKLSDMRRRGKHYQAKKVICLETGEIFDCIADATEKFKISKIGDVCNGKRSSAGGYHFQFLENRIPLRPLQKKNKYYDIDKKVICANTGIVYDNAKDCSLKLGVPIGDIRRVCRGQSATTRDLTFFFWEEGKEYIPREIKYFKSIPVLCIETGKHYDSLLKASKDMKLDMKQISKAAKNGTDLEGFHFSFD
jgi:group I intron endonuclease